MGRQWKFNQIYVCSYVCVSYNDNNYFYTIYFLVFIQGDMRVKLLWGWKIRLPLYIYIYVWSVNKNPSKSMCLYVCVSYNDNNVFYTIYFLYNIYIQYFFVFVQGIYHIFLADEEGFFRTGNECIKAYICMYVYIHIYIVR